MSENDSDDVPELEEYDIRPDAPQIDRRQLPIGDPQRQFDEQQLDAALALKSEAQRVCDTDPDLALLKLSSAIEMFPTSTLFLTARSQLFFREGEYYLALRDADLSIERGGASFKALKLKGQCHEVLRDFREAEASFKQALQLENDEAVLELLQRVQKAAALEEQNQQRFEEAQAEKHKGSEQPEPKREKSVYERMNEEIQQKYGENPVYQTDLFRNLFNTAQGMDDRKAQELMKNEVLMQALNDDNFEEKLKEVAGDPAAAAKYANDEGFMRAFSQILGQFK